MFRSLFSDSVCFNGTFNSTNNSICQELCFEKRIKSDTVFESEIVWNKGKKREKRIDKAGNMQKFFKTERLRESCRAGFGYMQMLLLNL